MSNGWSMSALHSIADIHCGNRNVRFWPILLQKSVAGFFVSDSVAVMRSATGA